MNDGDTTTKTEKHDWSGFDAMTDAEVHEAALNDPDAETRRAASEALLNLVPGKKEL